jgi:hypothetical protein
MVNCAASALSKLVKEADNTAPKAKRRQNPAEAEKWRLKFRNYNARAPKSSITVFDISGVSYCCCCCCCCCCTIVVCLRRVAGRDDKNLAAKSTTVGCRVRWENKDREDHECGPYFPRAFTLSGSYPRRDTRPREDEEAKYRDRKWDGKGYERKRLRGRIGGRRSRVLLDVQNGG